VAVRCEPALDPRSHEGAMLRLQPIADNGIGRSGARRDHPTFGWDSLTDTESSVTELVIAGLTNQEVAERLFMSRHTVGSHLRSIFRKVGVSSRVDLTRLAVQRDRTGSSAAH
jgi:DNA-binding CsgD family transcriptional regulator